MNRKAERRAGAAWTCFLAIALAGAALPLAAQTPISCGMTITAPGDYILSADLPCSATPAVQIGASDVDLNLNGRTLTGPGLAALGTGIIVGAAGAACVAVSRVRVHSGKVTNFQRGIDLCAPAGAVTTGVQVRNVVLTEFENGIRLFNSNANNISDNLLIGNHGAALALTESHRNLVSGNTMNDPRTFETAAGISLRGSNENVIYFNSVAGQHAFGIGVYSSNANVVMANSVTGTVSLFSDVPPGIVLGDGSAGNIIQINRANDNSYGIQIQAGEGTNTGNKVARNRALGNSVFDLFDGNPLCDANVWRNNVFLTANQTCID